MPPTRKKMSRVTSGRTRRPVTTIDLTEELDTSDDEPEIVQEYHVPMDSMSDPGFSEDDLLPPLYDISQLSIPASLSPEHSPSVSDADTYPATDRSEVTAPVQCTASVVTDPASDARGTRSPSPEREALEMINSPLDLSRDSNESTLSGRVSPNEDYYLSPTTRQLDTQSIDPPVVGGEIEIVTEGEARMDLNTTQDGVEILGVSQIPRLPSLTLRIRNESRQSPARNALLRAPPFSLRSRRFRSNQQAYFDLIDEMADAGYEHRPPRSSATTAEDVTTVEAEVAQPGPVVQPYRDPVCPICMDTLRDIVANGRHLLSTLCGHLFCSQCLPNHVRTNGYQRRSRCPACNAPLSPRLPYHSIFW